MVLVASSLLTPFLLATNNPISMFRALILTGSLLLASLMLGYIRFPVLSPQVQPGTQLVRYSPSSPTQIATLHDPSPVVAFYYTEPIRWDPIFLGWEFVSYRWWRDGPQGLPFVGPANKFIVSGFRTAEDYHDFHRYHYNQLATLLWVCSWFVIIVVVSAVIVRYLLCPSRPAPVPTYIYVQPPMTEKMFPQALDQACYYPRPLSTPAVQVYSPRSC
jgi:hypothetical protein